MEDQNPKVSIGLAVFNGEKYIREAIDSILAQTFTDFELIISDNASTDRTEEICRDYVVRDPRVRYQRNSTNIGGANNENLTFQLSKGKYFRLAAHDDVLAPELIAKYVEVLDNEPTVVLVYSTIVKIDENGKHIGLIDKDLAVSPKVSNRFRELANWLHGCEISYGLIRSSILHKTDLQLNYSDSDRTLLCELSLYGRFYRIPEPLFYKRYHSQMSTVAYTNDPLVRMAWFHPSDDEKIPNRLQFHLIQFSHYLKILKRALMPLNDRINCYICVSLWLLPQITREIIRELLLLFVPESFLKNVNCKRKSILKYNHNAKPDN